MPKKERVCVKCGYERVSPFWHRESAGGYFESPCNFYGFRRPTVHENREHLHYYCECGYNWVEVINS